MTDVLSSPMAEAAIRPPRVGFLGVGWIGLNRMKALLEAGAVEAVAFADPSDAMAQKAQEAAPDCTRVEGLEGLLALGLDGLVIATPSALHAAQAARALEAGVAVFCQKPLGRSREEVASVVEAARRADRLLAMDLSYRHVEAMRQVCDLVRSGAIGRVFHVDLTFHNAYGPDKPWFYDTALAGGGCVMDLGTHLVDLVLWTLDQPVVQVASTLMTGGRPPAIGEVEDFCAATLILRDGAVVRLTCSWRLPAGCDAVIAADFYGTEGGAAFHNVDGSFYDFTAEHMRGASSQRLVAPPDDWGGRAAAAWARTLAINPGFDPQVERLLDLAAIIDRIYDR